MSTDSETPAQALEREHREIDEGIAAFVTSGPRQHDVEALRTSLSALRRHIYIEEELLFPPLNQELMAPVFVMLREHAQIWQTLDAVDEQLAGGQGGNDVTARLLRQLAVELQHHNMKEERVLYAQSETVLDAHTRLELSTALMRGTLPRTWLPRRCPRNEP